MYKSINKCLLIKYLTIKWNIIFKEQNKEKYKRNYYKYYFRHNEVITYLCIYLCVMGITMRFT